ncbi:MAG: glycerol-3-phosphate 1-O-acyltransferase PlsY [Alphaproteobacteria bacterium]|nr:glycerol-3-phosphate 1-O-acyltransferase PlsY [Alphaproteobacteria bacterium]
MIYVILLAAAYLLGSIPFGWLMVWLMGKGDIRKVGTSGGTGATNVARVIGMPGFLSVFALDMAKTVAAVLLGAHFGTPAFGALCGFVSIVGHCFPIWLKFKGGKGNASMFGVLLAVNPVMFVVVGIEWLMVAIATKYSSLGALVGFLIMPVLGFAMSFKIGLIFIAIAVLCFWTHRENIQRLLNGTESKIQMNVKKLAIALVLIGLLALGLIVVFNVL